MLGSGAGKSQPEYGSTLIDRDVAGLTCTLRSSILARVPIDGRQLTAHGNVTRGRDRNGCASGGENDAVCGGIAAVHLWIVGPGIGFGQHGMQRIVAYTLIRIRSHVGALAEGRLRGIERDVLHGIDIAVGIGADARITRRILNEGSALAGMVEGRRGIFQIPTSATHRAVAVLSTLPSGRSILAGISQAKRFPEIAL